MKTTTVPTLPDSITSALKASRFHYITQRGAIIPLALITDITPVGTIVGEWDIAKWDGNSTTYHNALPSGSLAVAVAGFEGGVICGETIIGPDEVASFATALSRLACNKEDA